MPEPKELPDIFKDLIWNNLVKLALAQLFKAVPFLGIPGVGCIVSWIVMEFMGKLYDGLKEIIDLKVIAIKNHELRLKYDVASVTLYSLAQTHGEDSDEYKKALAQEDADFASFIRTNRR